MKRYVAGIIILVFSCNFSFAQERSGSLEDQVEDLISQMTLDEKTCQLATLYGSGKILQDALSADQWKSEIWKDGIANIDEQANGIGNYAARLSWPWMASVDNRQNIQQNKIK
ncbi:MAG: hypothetical protein LBG15_14545 [Dysgonamonadaceae bacterium]|jgi:beta-glucosidase|nr:hypothetical protein [Dysgonamonadaceae bacterium]